MQILDRLGSGDGLPAEAIRAATADRASVTPLLLEALDRYEATSEVEEAGLFFAFHLLGQWREKSAYRTLARFLRRPDVELVLGDAVTETSHRVLASVFDGDPQPIYDIIGDTEADEFVRGRVFDALVILVFRGELDRTAVADFLRSAFDDLQPREMNAVWDGWQAAVALLALTDLAPLVRQAYQGGFIDEFSTRPKDFEDDLKRACNGHPLRPGQEKEYEPFGDVIDEMSPRTASQPKQPPDRIASSQRLDPWPGMPVHNPFRNVGRNDPCPCGSGKKFKKCCLGKEPPQILAPDDSFDMDEPFDADDAFEDDGLEALDNSEEPIQDYDPLIAPHAEDWLATDEQWRLDLIARYHVEEGFDAQRAALHASIHATIENQIAEGDRWPARRALQRLMTEGLDRHEAIHAIGSVLAVRINELMRAHHSQTGSSEPQSPLEFDNDAYFSEVEKLTAKEWLRSG